MSTWEQQLHQFIKLYFDATVLNNYNDIEEKSIKYFKIDEKIFNEIKDYRYLSNVLKHGENSRDFSRLPVVFKEVQGKFDSNKLNVNFIHMPILNICEQTLVDIEQLLIKFWKNIFEVI